MPSRPRFSLVKQHRDAYNKTMKVNVEFLDTDPIENVITCLNYKMDKVVYFGYPEVIAQYRDMTEEFLRKHCGVEDICFYEVSEQDLDDIEETIEAAIRLEKEAGNDIYVDVTGGESLVLVAFGVFAASMEIPMHAYDINAGTFLPLDRHASYNIENSCEKQDVPFDLDAYIALYGGQVNYRLHKGLKSVTTEEQANEIDAMWDVMMRHAADWNRFSNYLKNTEEAEFLSIERNLTVKPPKFARENSMELYTFYDILDDCEKAGLLYDVHHDADHYGYTYKNSTIRDCFWDAGSILELHTYLVARQYGEDCRIGLHLDWDGVIHNQPDEDTTNEIDVLLLHGYCPVFISCKNGHVKKDALYELETVANRFGGKHAKKVLVATKDLTQSDYLRAKEMGIIVISSGRDPKLEKLGRKLLHKKT